MKADPPYILPDDAAALPADYVAQADVRFDLLPMPFVGDAHSAAVVLLLQNPGWHEQDAQDVRDSIYRDLAMTSLLCVPFVWCLDRRVRQTPAGQWWYPRFRWLIEDCGDRVSSGVACVQWFPYHSRAFAPLPDDRILPSQHFSFQLVSEAMGRGAIIVLLHARMWLRTLPELASYPGLIRTSSPRNSYVSPGNLTAGGYDRVRDAVLAHRFV